MRRFLWGATAAASLAWAVQAATAEARQTDPGEQVWAVVEASPARLYALQAPVFDAGGGKRELLAFAMFGEPQALWGHRRVRSVSLGLEVDCPARRVAVKAASVRRQGQDAQPTSPPFPADLSAMTLAAVCDDGPILATVPGPGVFEMTRSWMISRLGLTTNATEGLPPRSLQQAGARSPVVEEGLAVCRFDNIPGLTVVPVSNRPNDVLANWQAVGATRPVVQADGLNGDLIVVSFSGSYDRFKAALFQPPDRPVREIFEARLLVDGREIPVELRAVQPRDAERRPRRGYVVLRDEREFPVVSAYLARGRIARLEYLDYHGAVAAGSDFDVGTFRDALMLISGNDVNCTSPRP